MSGKGHQLNLNLILSFGYADAETVGEADDHFPFLRNFPLMFAGFIGAAGIRNPNGPVLNMKSIASAVIAPDDGVYMIGKGIFRRFLSVLRYNDFIPPGFYKHAAEKK